MQPYIDESALFPTLAPRAPQSSEHFVTRAGTRDRARDKSRSSAWLLPSLRPTPVQASRTRSQQQRSCGTHRKDTAIPPCLPPEGLRIVRISRQGLWWAGVSRARDIAGLCSSRCRGKRRPCISQRGSQRRRRAEGGVASPVIPTLPPRSPKISAHPTATCLGVLLQSHAAPDAVLTGYCAWDARGHLRRSQHGSPPFSVVCHTPVEPRHFSILATEMPQKVPGAPHTEKSSGIPASREPGESRSSSGALPQARLGPPCKTRSEVGAARCRMPRGST